jgi:5-methyltetrahydropteroyltriglutamate--homocysteine methyltransferase
VPEPRFLLEFDDDRAGGFEPLRYVPRGKVVVLGLVRGGNKLSQQDQFRKLRIVADAAISAWGLEG